MSAGKDKIAAEMVTMINQMVDKQINDQLESFRIQEEMILVAFKEKEEEKAKVYIEQELRELRSDVLKKTVKSRWDYKKTLFIRRNEMVDQLFTDVKEQLGTFRQSIAYPNYITYYLQECEKYIDFKECAFHIHEGEERYFKDLPKESEIIISKSNHLGGFVCVAKEKGIHLDYRIDKKLEEQRAWFINHSQLVIS